MISKVIIDSKEGQTWPKKLEHDFRMAYLNL